MMYAFSASVILGAFGNFGGDIRHKGYILNISWAGIILLAYLRFFPPPVILGMYFIWAVVTSIFLELSH